MTIVNIEPRKSRQQKEAKLVNEWLWEEHRTSPQWRRVRLGPMPNKEFARMYMVTLRWIDAIYLESGVVHLVEAKLKPSPDAIGQLLLYEDLFKATPEFRQYRDWPIQKEILTTSMDIGVAETARKQNIDMIIYEPKEFEELRKNATSP